MEKNPITFICKSIILSDQPTLNGRIYPKSVINKMCEQINHKRGRLFGSIGISAYPRTVSSTSHAISGAFVDNDALMVECQILNIPEGDRLLTILESDKLGISIGGYGTVVNGIVQNDYTVHEVNIVPGHCRITKGGSSLSAEAKVYYKAYGAHNGIHIGLRPVLFLGGEDG